MLSPSRVVRSCCLLILASAASLHAQQTYEVVIQGGRVMDPESGLDAVRNVGISGGVISAVTSEPPPGKTTIDAASLVVAPGVIDLHEHAQVPASYKFPAHHGVTTSLELELGTHDRERFYSD